jgi:hypothetical protein
MQGSVLIRRIDVYNHTRMVPHTGKLSCWPSYLFWLSALPVGKLAK